MKKKPQPYLNYVYLAIILIAVVLVVMLFFIKEETTLSTEDDGIKNTYVTNILKKRLTKDVDIIDNTASRFNLGERDKFAKKNLQYFYPDKDFRVLAEFVTDTSTPIFQMPTTTERKPNYRIYGYMRFNIGDTVCKLTVYQNVDFMNSPDYDSTLFIPFNDNTNGLYTYVMGNLHQWL